MSNEIYKIQESIKKLLRLNNTTYEKLAGDMDVSLTTIKRYLNGSDITFSKLIEISSCIGLSIYELIDQSKNQQMDIHQFTLQQERLLTVKFVNFAVFRMIIMNKDLIQIQAELNLSKRVLSGIVNKLEAVDLIELWPQDKIKKLVSFPFKWIDDGPLENKYNEIVLKKTNKEIFNYGINKSNNCNVKELLLNKHEAESYMQEIDEVINKYSMISQMRLKQNSPNCQVFSLLTLSGYFSWWEDELIK
jgi:transcriptional regulator with XRE-family HTH domain